MWAGILIWVLYYIFKLYGRPVELTPFLTVHLIGIFSGTGMMGIGGAVQYFQEQRQKASYAIDIQRVKSTNAVDISEKGRSQDGSEISLDRRLYMQFLAFGAAQEPSCYIEYLDKSGIPGARYEDLNDPNSIGLLTFSEDPDDFLSKARTLLRTSPFTDLKSKPEYTMLGRTYTIGYESDLEKVLIRRPIERVTDPSLPWVVWYPVRRSGVLEQLSSDEQRTIL